MGRRWKPTRLKKILNPLLLVLLLGGGGGGDP